MTQLQQARAGQLTAEMRAAAERKGNFALYTPVLSEEEAVEWKERMGE